MTIDNDTKYVDESIDENCMKIGRKLWIGIGSFTHTLYVFDCIHMIL